MQEQNPEITEIKTADLADLPPIEALDALKHIFDVMVPRMRKVSAPPTGIERVPLNVRTGEAAKLLGRSVQNVRDIADQLEIGREEGKVGEYRSFSPADMVRMRQEMRIGPLPKPGTSPFTLVVFNQKGGVGKTTTVGNLAQDMASRGYRILIVDMDPQASMTSSWLLPDAQGNLTGSDTWDLALEDTAAPVLMGEQFTFDGLIRSTHWPNVDIVPAHPDLSEGVLGMVRLLMQHRGDFWVAFREACQALSTDQYDVVIVDTAPALALDTVEIALAADGLLVPLPARNLDIESVRSFVMTLQGWLSDLARRYPMRMKWLRFIMTQRQTGSSSEARNEALLKGHLGPLLMTGRVPRLEALERSSGPSPSIYEVPPVTPKSAGRSASEAREGLRRVHDEIIELIAQSWARED